LQVEENYIHKFTDGRVVLLSNLDYEERGYFEKLTIGE
jgi:hypothetical protein